MLNIPRMNKFSKSTLDFLRKAGRQKHPIWLDCNQAEYQNVLREPLTFLAETVVRNIRPLALDYYFPKKGLGRIKRTANSVANRGGGLYKDWVTYSASKPRTSRFEHNPNLFFLINTEDTQDPVLVAGGLYMPSSQQIRIIREAVAANLTEAQALDKLFASKHFKKRFPDGFSKEKTSTRFPRGFDQEHPRMDWLKLQAFFVWRPYKKREFYSSQFADLVSEDFALILKLNRILEGILSGHSRSVPRKIKFDSNLLQTLNEVTAPRHEMDF